MIRFIDSTHSYINLETQEKYQSVSGFWKPYFPEFNSEEQSLRIAYEQLMPEDYSEVKKVFPWDSPQMIDYIKKQAPNTPLILTTQSEILKEWAENSQLQSSLGNEEHLVKENLARSQKGAVNPFDSKFYKIIDNPTEFDNQTYFKGLENIPEGVLPETLIHYHPLKLAGQADKKFFFKVGNQMWFDQLDYKTDKKIEFKGFYSKFKKQTQKLLPPLDFIEDCNFNRYTLKMSTYAYMLELAGYRCRNIGILSIGKGDYKDREPVLYKVPYKRSLVKRIFDLEISKGATT